MGGKGATSQQEIKLSPEAQQLMSDELRLFMNTVLPAQTQLQGQIGRGLVPGLGGNLAALPAAALAPLSPGGIRGTPAAQATRRAQDLAQTATRVGGAAGGLPGASLNRALAQIETESPELLGNLQNVFRGIAEQQQGFADPRFAQFLRPDVTTTTEQGTGAQAAQAASMAIAAAGVAAAII